MQKKHTIAQQFFFLRVGLLSCLVLFCAATLSAAFPIGSDRMPHLVWEQIKMEHSLPSDPITIAAATNLGDFVVVTKNGNDPDIYLLDHTHLNIGWQKKGTLKHLSVSSVQYGLGRFFIFGIDRENHHSVVATSCDHGNTWEQREIVDSTSHYDAAAFSATQGVVTGREGAVARTDDGVTWTQVFAPSGSAKKVTYLQRDQNKGLGFMLMEATSQKRDGFFSTDDFSAKEMLFSSDGVAWSKRDDLTNSAAADSGQLLIYKEKGFAYHYPGIDTKSDYSMTPAKGVAPNFAAASMKKVPLFKMVDEIISPIGRGMGWISLGKDLKTEQSVVIYSGNRTFFVADAIPAASGNPLLAISATVRTVGEEATHSENGVIVIAGDGSGYIASTE